MAIRKEERSGGVQLLFGAQIGMGGRRGVIRLTRDGDFGLAD